jgi:uncharacterized protein (TIGR03437 family)
LDATFAGGPNDDIVQGLALASDGTISLNWGAVGHPVLSRIRFGSPGWVAPACLSPDALNAATFHSNGWVTPGEFVTLTGFGIGPEEGVAYQSEDPGLPPRQLAGVQVLFDGVAAPVLYVQSRQVNAVAPFELSGKNSTNISVKYNDITLGPVAVKVNFGSNGFFRLQPGASSQAAAVNEDGTQNSSLNPAPRGSTVMLWGTGFGSIDPPCATGGLNPPKAVRLAADLSVNLDVDVVTGVAGTFFLHPTPAAHRDYCAVSNRSISWSQLGQSRARCSSIRNPRWIYPAVTHRRKAWSA